MEDESSPICAVQESIHIVHILYKHRYSSVPCAGLAGGRYSLLILSFTFDDFWLELPTRHLWQTDWARGSRLCCAVPGSCILRKLVSDE